ncbi:TatD family [Gilbertella persicaria]|uniref:TatD family n=1 Tax=Gilbertella persicaria TaxID=101096 RepID=UPI00221FAD8E|nr:TatD family [Gilbertella persicaria]KAI8077926.1 TatD family [Gilbertella persicaria]
MCGDQPLFQHNVPITQEEFHKELYRDLCDAHCHPHDDIDKLALIPQLKTGHITIMGVRQDDWDRVSQVTEECNLKYQKRCVPCFGNDHKLQDMVNALADPSPYDTWYTHLHHKLQDHPEALVGEIGIDRSARLLPGGAIDWHGKKPTQVHTSVDHQLAILDIQCQLARELNRGVSLHCVQGQGHLFDYMKKQSLQFSTRQLRKLNYQPNTLRVCLHSFGGSPATITQFMELKGFEFYVSFSVAINAQHLPAHKMQALIQAVPEDRLLIESDLNTPEGIDICMVDIVKIVAEARGWSIEQVVNITNKNWKRFVHF